MNTHIQRIPIAMVALLLAFLTVRPLTLAASPPALQSPNCDPTAPITRVSMSSDGVESNSGSVSPSISGDGRYVVFSSQATTLVSGDTAIPDVYLHDRQTCQTTRISVAPDGSAANSNSFIPAISGDGNVIVFSSLASNLVAEDTNGQADVYAFNRQTGQMTLISVASSGTLSNGRSENVSISYDGQRVVFESEATNLVNGDTNGVTDIFVHNLQTGQTRRVSVASTGVQGNQQSKKPTISADGRWVAFWSDATNLVNGDTNNRRDVFSHDVETGTTFRVSVASDGTQSNGWPTDFPSLSGDGRLVAFDSDASDLVSDDTNGYTDLFIHDQQTRQTTKVFTSGEPNAAAGSPLFSQSGRYIAFGSTASNLVSGDTDNSGDIFVHDRETGETTRVSNGSSGITIYYAISADGSTVTFVSAASDLVSGDTNGQWDVFVARVQFSPMFHTSTPPPTTTATPTRTPSRTPTVTHTPTHTRTPFECSRITHDIPYIQNNSFRVNISNANDLDAVLTRVVFPWKPMPEYPDMFVSAFYMGNSIHWRGQDKTPPTDTMVDSPESFSTNSTTRTIFSYGAAIWSAGISNGPATLPNLYDYTGTQLYFLNPTDNTDCIITIDLGEPPPTATPNPGATITPTPDCRASSVRLRFYAFESYGRVRMRVQNNRTTVARLTDFNIQWRQPTVSKLNLARVTAFAPYGSVGSVLVWQSSDTATQDEIPPTRGKAEGIWQQNFTFPPQSTTNLFLDFDGTTSNLSNLGVIGPDFEGSTITIDGGACPGVTIPIDPIPTPAPTNTPRPTDTPIPYKSPTPRPTGTLPTRTPTATPTAKPPTAPPPSPPPPDCPTGQITARFMEFQTYGLVRLDVTNNRSTDTWLDEFNVEWMNYGGLSLNRVNAIAPQGMPGSGLVWDSGSSSEDASPPTVSYYEGQLYSFLLPANSTTSLYLDYDGTTASLNSLGAQPEDFTGTWFDFWCGAGMERVYLDVMPTFATPTFTPSATYTPSPTFVYTATPSATTTATPTLPPTFTPVPTETPVLASGTPTLDLSATPVCNTGSILVWAAAFEPYGLVQLEVTNTHRYDVVLLDFEIQWQQPPSTGLNLRQINAQAAPGMPNSQLIWRSSSENEDSSPPTVRHDGLWVGTLTVPANASQTVYLDFNGTSGYLPTLGLDWSHFDNSWFDFEIFWPGSGSCPLERVFLNTEPHFHTTTFTPSAVPTSVATDTPTPSFTPSSTYTPSATPDSQPGPTFTVNTADDTDDGRCSLVHCSFREAIKAANIRPGADAITFNIPGSGVHTIRPITELPAITDATYIHADMQPGYSGTPLIELDGSLAGAGKNGLTVSNGPSSVVGFAINRWSGSGIWLNGGYYNSIANCVIGTDPSGMIALGNGEQGIQVDSPRAQIGSIAPGHRNIISGNGQSGIWLNSSSAEVYGNSIGVNASGTGALPNGTGITITGLNSLIGTREYTGAENIISGNTGSGIVVSGRGNAIIANRIGTDITGTLDLGNAVGVLINTEYNQVGDLSTPNFIAFNRGDGILVSGDATKRVYISSNRIYANGDMGLDLDGDGPTSNDPGDTDTGTNDRQNYPALNSVNILGDVVTLSGTLDSTPNTNFVVDFFANETCDPSGYGEGQVMIGESVITTDASGSAVFTFSMGRGVQFGNFITATARRSDGNTSEFSPCFTATRKPDLIAPANESSVTEVQPIFSWLAVPGATRYELQVGRDNLPDEIITLATNSYTPPVPLLPYTYYWRVRAFGTNHTDWSDTWSLTITSPPNAMPQYNLFSVRTPTLSWSRITWAVQYEIQISSDPAFGRNAIYNLSDVVDGNVPQYTIPAGENALPDGVYYWRVRAKNTNGAWSRWSAADRFVVDVP